MDENQLNTVTSPCYPNIKLLQKKLIESLHLKVLMPFMSCHPLFLSYCKRCSSFDLCSILLGMSLEALQECFTVWVTVRRIAENSGDKKDWFKNRKLTQMQNICTYCTNSFLWACEKMHKLSQWHVQLGLLQSLFACPCGLVYPQNI